MTNTQVLNSAYKLVFETDFTLAKTVMTVYWMFKKEDRTYRLISAWRFVKGCFNNKPVVEMTVNMNINEGRKNYYYAGD